MSPPTHPSSIVINPQETRIDHYRKYHNIPQRSLMMLLIGESLDFGFYFFKQQFKASLEQFYIF